MSTRKSDPEAAAGETPPAKKAKIQDPCGNVLDPLLSKTDIWVDGILPFLGPGYFIFVALVSHRFKELYFQYFSSVKDAPLVKRSPYARPTKAISCNTFYRAAFASVSCAEYWYKVAEDDNRSLSRNRVCAVVAKYGKLEVLKWARHQQGFAWNITTCNAAAGNGHLDLLRYAHSNGCRWDEWTCKAAAQSGHLAILKYLHSNGCPYDTSVCQSAAENGHLGLLKWAHENGCPWDKRTCHSAAYGGQLEVLKYLHEKGCPWNQDTCMNAAEKGHLEVLKYAHEKECPWSASVCSNAAMNGHLEILKYAHDNGCHWDEWTCKRAAFFGHSHILEYAHEHGCPGSEDYVAHQA